MLCSHLVCIPSLQTPAHTTNQKTSSPYTMLPKSKTTSAAGPAC